MVRVIRQQSGGIGIVDIAEWSAIATVVVGIGALVAHTDRQIRRLRAEMLAGFDKLQAGLDDARAEARAGDNALRTEIHDGQNALRAEIHDGQNALRTEIRDGFNRSDARLQVIEERTYELSTRLPARG